ncbi:MAG: helix-turn-helix domain-containing protein [Candidatus Binatia bacterium]|nr:helix-turn-helix domain-containing protein [Candidatus Binatia bacterium]
MGEQVRIAFEEQERPTRTSIAKRLGMGDRTFQRRLHDEGTTFRAVVEQERGSVALSMLREPGCRVVDVAFAVGFDDATGFTKAFQRWTGESPSTYRAWFTKRDELPEAPRAGVYIDDVFVPSPASEAGIEAGDVLVAVGGRELLSVSDFQRELYLAGVGREVSLSIHRGGNAMTKRAKIEQRPKDLLP